MRGAQTRRRLVSVLGVVVLLSAVVASGCGSNTDNATPPNTTTAATPQDFSGRGPYAVGVTKLALDATRPVLVFYPVDRTAVPADAVQYAYTPEDMWGTLAAVFPPGSLQTTPVDDAWRDLPISTTGPFPVVIHSHGRGSNYQFASRHNAHTASWGYVVVAPAHPSRDNVVTVTGTTIVPTATDEQTIFDTLDLLSTENRRSEGPLNGTLDVDRVAVEGHSGGGRTAGVAAYDPRIDAWIGLAAVAPVTDDATGGRNVVTDSNGGFDPAHGEFDLSAYLAGHPPPDKPSMVVFPAHGLNGIDDDAWVTDAHQIWTWLPPPKRLVELTNTGWNVFMDYCELEQQAGGMQSVIDALHPQGSALDDVRSAEMGCVTSYAPVSEVTAVWNHLTIAFLNQTFSINPSVAAASLQADYLNTTFPGRISTYLVDQ